MSSGDDKIPDAPYPPYSERPQIFPARPKSAAQKWREANPNPLTRDMMYDRLQENFIANLPGNRPKSSKTESSKTSTSTSPTPPKRTIKKTSTTNLPPLLHLDKYRHENNPETVRTKKRRQLLERGHNVNRNVVEPQFEATKTVSASSSLCKATLGQISDCDTMSDYSSGSRPSTSDSDELNSIRTKPCITPQDVVNFLEKTDTDHFLYVVFAYPPTDTRYDPFKLRIVNFNQLTNVDGYNHSMDYLTVNKRGIVRLKTNSLTQENVKKIALAQGKHAKRYAKLEAMVSPSNDQSFEYIELDRWLEEFKNHKKLMKMRTFKMATIHKAFSTWRRNVRRGNVEKTKKALEEKMYILNSSLRPALLNVRNLCDQIASQSLCKIEEGKTYSLEYFLNQQIRSMGKTLERMKEFRGNSLRNVQNACRAALLEEGFTPDDQYLKRDLETGQLLPPDETTIEVDPPEKMTYNQQTRKRKKCERLTHFIRLCDYIIVDSMHSLCKNSIDSLRERLQSQNCLAPSHDEIASWVNHYSTRTGQVDLDAGKKSPAESMSMTNSEADENEAEFGEVYECSDDGSEASSHLPYDASDAENSKRPIPLFQTKIVVDDSQMSINSLQFEPCEETFVLKIGKIIEKFEETCKTVYPLVNDVQFESFTKPLINRKFELKNCGEGPKLHDVLEDDVGLGELKSDIENFISDSFDRCDSFSNHLLFFYNFFRENEECDVDIFNAKDSVKFFRDALDMYAKQSAQIRSIHDSRKIGMLLVDNVHLKNTIGPSPLKMLDALNDMLPKLAKSKLEALISELNDTKFKLDQEPTNTEDYVNHLTFLDGSVERQPFLVQEGNTIKRYYALFKKYGVPAPPEDYAIFESLQSTISGVRDSVDRCLAERDSNVDKLCGHIDKDNQDLGNELKDLKTMIQQPSLLDKDTPVDEVEKEMKIIDETIDDLLTRAHTHKSYQKKFKMEVTKYEELEEVDAELKLKHLAWKVQSEWKALTKEWSDMSFLDLQPDALIAQLQLYTKNIVQLEKGLPPNTLVPVLRQMIESSRAEMGAIAALRNPCMEGRHWGLVEKLLEKKLHFDEKFNIKIEGGFDPTPEQMREMDSTEGLEPKDLTLSQLRGWGVLEDDKRAEELEAVAGQASGEQALKSMLSKVEDVFKELELVVLSHKDSKDVFILGGTDDVQAQLDDGRVMIATIASSRYVGPIKPKVEDWQRNLNLMSDTLDEWLVCQRSWLYLESIFSAPDIQRQLPQEAKMFTQVDKSWKDIMRKTERLKNALRACTQPGLLEAFKLNNKLLDQIQKCLEQYLESKRVVFPRFYFLSNDELLEILAQTKNPLAVQPHMRKCFDAISSLTFGKNEATGAATADILGMNSPEKEHVPLTKGLKARGNVEDWLCKVEEAMVVSLRKLTKASLDAFAEKPRHEWVKDHASQVMLTVSQTMWCTDLTAALSQDQAMAKEGCYDKKTSAMRGFEQVNVDQLMALATIVRERISPLLRHCLGALITIDVHARDIVTDLANQGVNRIDDFEWIRQVRYYWDTEIKDAVVRCSDSRYVYGYEYLGASARLVITPLTDRCYLCLMGALQLDLGGAPAGPAGTGKTETTKDLAKALAKQCIVFNCSDQMDYRMMGKFFSGLAQSGAWACFDEFNRIDIEVLSVIAQQLLTIMQAKKEKRTRFMFEGREIKLEWSCASFITMNPGYAGRTELPDNLKALFRPMSMMVPDYRLIAEVILFSEGFEDSKKLAQKMTQMYKLCSEQLSQQDHYDFGMRAVKSVLVMAGSLKRDNPEIHEDITLIRALRDSNLPKFLKNDAILFRAILTDLFPGAVIPAHDYGVFKTALETATDFFSLQQVPSQAIKVIQFYETLLVRHGVMLVGPTGGGKSTVHNILTKTLCLLREQGHSRNNPNFKPVVKTVLNPKSINMGELYGEEDSQTMEWQDGLMAILVRKAAKASVEGNDAYHYIVCDGPVDALWIENMNTVLDDNKTLCLANSERIKLSMETRMIFEVQDLAVASPATVSRCGMVYIDTTELGWKPYVRTWIKELGNLDEARPACIKKDDPELKDHILDLFDTFVEASNEFIENECIQIVQTCELGRVASLCAMFESCIQDTKLEVSKQMITQTWLWCYIWCMGGCLQDNNWEKWDTFVRGQCEDLADARLPTQTDLFSYHYNSKTKRWNPWTQMVPTYRYDPEIPFFDMLVPTVDTIRFKTVMQKFLSINYPVLFTGSTGVGKTSIAKASLMDAEFETRCGHTLAPVFINFSAKSSSPRTQEIIELRLEKRRKTLLSAPNNKQVVILIDDLNMPKPDTYGSQPPLEILRQIIDGGMYDRPEMYFKAVQGVTLTAACGPPGGGRTQVPFRLQRRFATFCLPAPSEQVLKTIFSSILNGFLQDFQQEVKDMSGGMVEASIEIYRRMATELLPTPAKSHYVFNLRDLSKCIQGIMRVDASTVRDPKTMFRLFGHEAQRVFHDRLICLEDKDFFLEILADVAGRFLKVKTTAEELLDNPFIFCDFMKPGVEKEDRIYEDMTDSKKKIVTQLEDYLEDYNLTYNKNVKLVFFSDAILHVARIARVLGQERGNALLVGVGGTGKQCLTRLAAHAAGCKCFQIELSRGYGYDAFHEDLRKLYRMAGVDGNETVFLFTDTQIVVEEFLEDINNILNSGEVPGLFEKDDLEQVLTGVRPHAKAAGVNEGDRDALWEFFIQRVRQKLHLVLAMSPVGDAFRGRCRQFPSLINCCTIDWFVQWPAEALMSVSESTFDVDSGPFLEIPPELKEPVCKMCVEIHSSAETWSNKFKDELNRYLYTTPTSYLELLSLFGTMLTERKKMLKTLFDRYSTGLRKLAETNDLVESMQIELTELEPILKVKSKETDELMESLAIDQEAADKVKVNVLADEKVAKVKAEETKAIADDAQRDLDQAIPMLTAANKALDGLDKSDIAEIRVFKTPPELVVLTMEAVCILMDQKADWAGAKVMLGDSQFMSKLINFDKDNVPMKILKKLKKYIDNPSFQPDIIEKVSKACKSMCFWARAINTYSYVVREVEPKKAKLAKANSELEEVMSGLAIKQAELKAVENKIESLQASYTESVEEKDRLMKKMSLTSARMKRAGKLTSALGEEGIRWAEKSEILTDQMVRSTGDALLSAAAVAYFGAFTSPYRVDLMQYWAKAANELGLPATEGADLETLIGDPFIIRQWNADGLPRDMLSTENALLVTKGRRWPLLIDPQNQANMWIRQREAKNGLKVVKATDSNFLRTLENAVRTGLPVLLEDVQETLDPALEPILLKQTFVSGGRTLIRLGDSDIDYDRNFRFYMTSQMANPHYLPELQIKVTLINFTVTVSGLEDQILSEVVKLERPDLEEQRSTLIQKINQDKETLDNIERQILKMLFESEGNILDNEALINTLNDSKITSGTVKQRLEEAERTEIKITAAREKYRPVAARSSVLYFVVASMSLVDPMYEYSLKYYKEIFQMTVESSEKSTDLETRLRILMEECTSAVYKNVARGLFERHKISFSFLMCIEIEKLAGRVTDKDFYLVLRGISINPDKVYPDRPKTVHSEEFWRIICELEELADDDMQFQDLKTLVQKQQVFVSIGETRVLLNADKHPSYINKSNDEYINFNEKITEFQKLVMARLFAEEKLLACAVTYVEQTIGKQYILPPPSAIPSLYQDMNQNIPLVFILSAGSDPMAQFSKFATEKGYGERYHVISLGQGQGPIAARMIESGVRSGDWIFLQNCHLAKSWMPAMESIVKAFTDTTQKRAPNHPDFRLWLSSMPTVGFPTSVLQSAVKVTNEPPAGLRANLKRSIESIEPDFYEKHQLGVQWRRSIMGLSFFHAIIQERKRFGPLGWNIPYEFNDSDRDCGFLNFNIWSKEGNIPWDALLYITGNVTYGGRVTDSWDQRLLNTIMRRFIGDECLEPRYSFSSDGIYRAPGSANTVEELKDYIDNLPNEDSPEVFGMHPNAQLAAQKREVGLMLDTLAMVTPKSGGGGAESIQNQQVLDVLNQVKAKLGEAIKSDHPCESLFVCDDAGRQNSMTVVLTQEITRFNNLLMLIHASLNELEKAISGLVVMSEEIDAVYVSFLMNEVPAMWSNAAYPSPKFLASWVQDLSGRCEFFRRWLEDGLPNSYRLSYFFFPQGFMTSNLQNYSRENTIAIDRLFFEFAVLPYTEWPDVLSPDHEEIENKLPKIESGVLIYGLYCDAFRWDIDNMHMAAEAPRIINEQMPVMHMIPRELWTPDENDYNCPLYKTPVRAGTLSTTGHSTNFVCPVNLKTDQHSKIWICKGSAMLCQLKD